MTDYSAYHWAKKAEYWATQAQGISIRYVEELPAEGQTNILYLVPNEDPSLENVYDEYIWALQDDETYDYEKIGTTQVDIPNNAADLVPSFDNMTPIETHTFDINTTDYYELFSKPNGAGTFDNPTDAQFDVWCRITTTNKEGTSTNPRIYQELDCVFREFGSSTQVVYGVIRSKPESVTAATTGIQTVRSIYPKATNSGKQWALELKAYNASARTVTVQVYKTATGVVWKDSAVISTYDSNHQSTVSINAYNAPGYLFLGPIAGTISSATGATSAGYITGSLSKTLASSTLKNTGYTITGNSLLFKIKGQALLAGIATTSEPIDVDFGICQAGATAASTATSTYTYTNFFQKHQFTPASSVNFAEAYENGDLIYARFTLSAGNIYSDNICSTTPTAGHTWYLIGMATSATAINFDNTESYFFTLDANGKMTHINGKEIAGGSSLPSQTGQSGKFLTTDGTDASWGIPKIHNLFDFKWTDYELSDQSWLRADTFSWQDGTVYSDAYNHLVDDIDGKTATSETVGSYTISYYLADDGHKITTDETNVANIYNESGVAWYYILDTTNQRFKLPRTKYGFTGLRDTVGKYVPESLPNIQATVVFHNGGTNGPVSSASGAAAATGKVAKYSLGTGSNSDNAYASFSINASSYSTAYQDNAPVQQRATQMYLYFYVGQFSQSATEQTAGLNAELFNGKVDLNAQNLSTQGKSLISGLGMPSSRYIDLTLLASGNSYTAPANGYFVISKRANAVGQYLAIGNETIGHQENYSSVATQIIPLIIGVKKGDVVAMYYNVGGVTERFSFVYAEGEV